MGRHKNYKSEKLALSNNYKAIIRELTIWARTDTIRYEYSSIHITQLPIPIRVLRALVSQLLVILDQAGRLENAAYTQWVAHADI